MPFRAVNGFVLAPRLPGRATGKMIDVMSKPGVHARMMVLLLGVSGGEASFQAWVVALEREGVPFETIVLGSPHTPVALVDGSGDALFQAVIVAGDLGLDETLSGSRRAALTRFEREFGVRQLTAYAYPGPEHGLSSPVWGGPIDGTTARLTGAGHAVFPYLRGTLSIEAGSWGYFATAQSEFEVLLEGPQGAALVGIHRHHDGRQEMVQTFDANPGQPQSQLLRHGQLAWVTGGTYLGHARNYLSLHLDDALLPNHSWNPDAHVSEQQQAALVRMSPDDASRAARWAHGWGLRLDLACNGGGSERNMMETGMPRDGLLDALAAQPEAFGWLNHTYGHLDLDEAPREAIEQEVGRNVQWAERAGIELEPGVLITGAHSGLANLTAVPPRGENPELAPALAAQEIRYIGCDASRPYPVDVRDPVGPSLAPGTPFQVGPALAVPRYPTILPYDAASAVQALDRHRTAGSTASSWGQLVEEDAGRIFRTVMSNDPRPHFFHQSNLIGDRGGGGIFYDLMDLVLERYHECFCDMPVVQPAFAEIGDLLVRWTAWRAALARREVTGYIEGSQVRIVNSASTSLQVPVSGTEAGTEYGGLQSGWLSASTGETVLAIDIAASRD